MKTVENIGKIKQFFKNLVKTSKVICRVEYITVLKSHDIFDVLFQVLDKDICSIVSLSTVIFANFL